jgi:hypothetical protein
MGPNRAGQSVRAVLAVLAALAGLVGTVVVLVAAITPAGARAVGRTGGAARQTMLGVDDSILLGGVLIVLVLGVAIMVFGASRPRRHR